MNNNPTFDLFVDQNTDFQTYITLEHIDAQGNSTYEDLSTSLWIKAQIRKEPDFSSELQAQFQVNITNPTKGEFAIYLTKEQTSSLISNSKSGSSLLGYYDILINNDSMVTKIVGGKVFINNTVTSYA